MFKCTIAGKIVDTATGMGIPGVTVKILQNDTEIAQTETNEKGEFNIPNIKREKVKLFYGKEGISPFKTEELDLKSMPKEKIASLKLDTTLNGAIIGKIIDMNTKEPVSQALVKIRHQNQDSYVEVYSTVDGIFQFKYLKPGKYELKIEHEFYFKGRYFPILLKKGEVLKLKPIKLTRIPEEIRKSTPDIGQMKDYRDLILNLDKDDEALIQER
jgi:5-hydroxyisourate hydrolase-like protein (transthyretin family)